MPTQPRHVSSFLLITLIFSVLLLSNIPLRILKTRILNQCGLEDFSSSFVVARMAHHGCITSGCAGNSDSSYEEASAPITKKNITPDEELTVLPESLDERYNYLFSTPALQEKQLLSNLNLEPVLNHLFQDEPSHPLVSLEDLEARKLPERDQNVSINVASSESSEGFEFDFDTNSHTNSPDPQKELTFISYGYNPSTGIVSRLFSPRVSPKEPNIAVPSFSNAEFDNENTSEPQNDRTEKHEDIRFEIMEHRAARQRAHRLTRRGPLTDKLKKHKSKKHRPRIHKSKWRRPMWDLTENGDPRFEVLNDETKDFHQKSPTAAEQLDIMNLDHVLPEKPARNDSELKKDSAIPSASTNGETSETPSTCSDQETDWNENDSSYSGGVEVFTTELRPQLCRNEDHESIPSTEPLIAQAKKQVVDRIMQDFWALFTQDRTPGITQCTESSVSEPGRTSTPDDTSNSGPMPNSPHTSRTGKRSIDQDQDNDPDNRRPPDPKRLKKDLLDADQSSLNFACPFRKKNPQKYGVLGIWKSCALTPLQNIARVKAHMYRHHRIFQCQRCKSLFNSSAEVDAHLQAVQSCDLQLEGGEVEGITDDIEKRLRSKKKTSKDQTAAERWKEIYRLIFPDEPVPEPYFEPVQEDMHSQQDTELLPYEEYSRRELPRMFRRAIEGMVNEGTSQLEEQLRSDLITIIRECQDRISSNYRQQRDQYQNQPSLVTRWQEYIESSVLPDHSEAKSNQEDSDGLTSADQLARIYQRPPSPPNNVVQLSDISSSNELINKEASSKDSGYTSDIYVPAAEKDSIAAEHDTSETSARCPVHMGISDAVEPVPLNFPDFPFAENGNEAPWNFEEENQGEKGIVEYPPVWPDMARNWYLGEFGTDQDFVDWRAI